jgi:hypothetical protein
VTLELRAEFRELLQTKYPFPLSDSKEGETCQQSIIKLSISNFTQKLSVNYWVVADKEND